jgi:serine protease Do/serine protease DegQ
LIPTIVKDFFRRNNLYRFHIVLFSLAAFCVASMPSLAEAQRSGALPPQAADLFSLAPMVESVTLGVVGISVSQSRSSENPLLNDPAFRRFFEELERDRAAKSGGNPRADAPEEVRPAGSGVIIDAAQGLVLTNHHVIQGSSRLVVVLKDRRQFEAQLVGSDAGTDLALLRIKPERLSEVKIGDADQLRIGDFVVAIGNPMGLGQSVTAGIVSALGRGVSPEGLEDYIQTDAAINPGNSGGALVNLRGELVGINTAILTGRPQGGGGGNIGIGFAVPTSMARQVIAQILKYGEVKRGRIGVQSAEVTQELATTRGLTAIAGAVIREVSPGSSAEKAGVRVNDIVLRVNGSTVRTSSDLRNKVALIPVGASAEMVLWRDGGERTAKVVVEAVAAPAVVAAAPMQSSAPGANKIEGMQLAVVPGGVGVSGVVTGSVAHSVGFRDGDIIVSVDREPVLTTQEFFALLVRSGRKVITVIRGDSKLRLSMG